MTKPHEYNYEVVEFFDDDEACIAWTIIYRPSGYVAAPYPFETRDLADAECVRLNAAAS